MVSIKHLFVISLLVLFCLAEIVPEEAAAADAQVSTEDSHVDEGSDQQSTEAAAEQIASDGTDAAEATLNDEGKIGSGIVAGGYGRGYSWQKFFKGGKRYRIQRFLKITLSYIIEIQITRTKIKILPCGCFATLISSPQDWVRTGPWSHLSGCGAQVISITRRFQRSFNFRGRDNSVECYGSDNQPFLYLGSAGP